MSRYYRHHPDEEISHNWFQDVQGALVPNVTGYPGAPGYKRTGTSLQAAQSMVPTASTLRDRVLEAIRARPSTADELADSLDASPFSIRPRVTELLKMGKIRETLERRRNASGRLAAVWEAV